MIVRDSRLRECHRLRQHQESNESERRHDGSCGSPTKNTWTHKTFLPTYCDSTWTKHRIRRGTFFPPFICPHEQQRDEPLNRSHTLQVGKYPKTPHRDIVPVVRAEPPNSRIHSTSSTQSAELPMERGY